MQRSIKSKEDYKDFFSKQIKNAGKTIIDFFKFIDWMLLSTVRVVKNTVVAIKNFAPLKELKKIIHNLNKFIQDTFPAERALFNFSILFVLAIITNPWLSGSLFEQHFYSLGFKIFSDLIFGISALGASVNAYSFILREFRKFKAKQIQERHARLLEREKACRHKPVKHLHSLNR